MLTLASAELGLLKVTGVPEIVCSPEQNRLIAEAMSNASRHMPAFLQLSDKQQDLIALVVAIGSVAQTQVAAYNERIRAENAKPVNATRTA